MIRNRLLAWGLPAEPTEIDRVLADFDTEILNTLALNGFQLFPTVPGSRAALEQAWQFGAGGR
jgi:hypothetical protein